MGCGASAACLSVNRKRLQRFGVCCLWTDGVHGAFLVEYGHGGAVSREQWIHRVGAFGCFVYNGRWEGRWSHLKGWEGGVEQFFVLMAIHCAGMSLLEAVCRHFRYMTFFAFLKRSFFHSDVPLAWGICLYSEKNESIQNSFTMHIIMFRSLMNLVQFME